MAHFIPFINVSDSIYIVNIFRLYIILLGTVIEYTRYSKLIVSILSNVMYVIATSIGVNPLYMPFLHALLYKFIIVIK